MKASELISSLEILIEKYGDLELIYSSDEEGNSYSEVCYKPTAFSFDGECVVEPSSGLDPTHFCIN